MNRRDFITCVSAAAGLVLTPVSARSKTFEESPLAAEIERSLSAAPVRKIKKNQRVGRKELRRRKDLRIAAPSIDIQSINFEFASARIPRDQRWKVEEISFAMRRILRRNPDEVFLIEGHTDAVGSRYDNQILSEQRAHSLKRLLSRHFGVDSYALETVGYGEDNLLVQTPYPSRRNRRVTLRRITDFITR